MFPEFDTIWPSSFNTFRMIRARFWNIMSWTKQDFCEMIFETFPTNPNLRDTSHHTQQIYYLTQYLLTSGKDSLIFLWELSTGEEYYWMVKSVCHDTQDFIFICKYFLGRAVSMYTGAKVALQHAVGATFNHTEDYSKRTVHGTFLKMVDIM